MQQAREVPGHPAGQGRTEDEAGCRPSDRCNASTQTSDPQRKVQRKARFAGESESRIIPQGKARQKEYRRKYLATPHGKAKRKEYMATPHGKSRRKEYERKTSAEDHERKGASHLTVRSASAEDKRGARRLIRYP